jgi:hypothetical protein
VFESLSDSSGVGYSTGDGGGGGYGNYQRFSPTQGYGGVIHKPQRKRKYNKKKIAQHQRSIKQPNGQVELPKEE